MESATITTNIDHATDLLEHLIDRHTGHTSLIICSTRNDFLDQITPTILPPTPQLVLEPRGIPPSQESVGDEDDDEQNNEPTSHPQPPRHRLLTPTLALLARSRNIKLVYCPSVDTLRAYLSSYVVPAPTTTTSYHEGSAPRPITPGPMKQPSNHLTILNAVALHHATSQFSAQGLSRTFSTAVHAAHHNGTSLTLCECSDLHDPTNPHRGPRLWDAEVPLLSDSVRLGGGSAGSNFAAARTVSVGRVTGRWFSFEGQQHNIRQEVDDDSNEEMLV